MLSSWLGGTTKPGDGARACDQGDAVAGVLASAYGSQANWWVFIQQLQWEHKPGRLLNLDNSCPFSTLSGARLGTPACMTDSRPASGKNGVWLGVAVFPFPGTLSHLSSQETASKRRRCSLRCGLRSPQRPRQGQTWKTLNLAWTEPPGGPSALALTGSQQRGAGHPLGRAPLPSPIPGSAVGPGLRRVLSHTSPSFALPLQCRAALRSLFSKHNPFPPYLWYKLYNR